MCEPCRRSPTQIIPGIHRAQHAMRAGMLRADDCDCDDDDGGKERIQDRGARLPLFLFGSSWSPLPLPLAEALLPLSTTPLQECWAEDSTREIMSSWHTGGLIFMTMLNPVRLVVEWTMLNSTSGNRCFVQIVMLSVHWQMSTTTQVS